MSFLETFLLLVITWAALTLIISLLVSDPDIRLDYYEAKLDFMIWLAQHIMRNRHNGGA